MTSKPGLLARIFRRGSRSPVVSKLYTHAFGQPLLVHPTMGERLIGAYLDGAVDAPEELSATSGSVAIINVSGALVNRPMPDICGSGPASYEAIRCAFDEVLDDDNVKAIVLRMDSPGGMCAGCFDLTDYIFASRGKKPIVAQVDDMAYSAAYAIAAACDRIQITRTAGVGSIGVYTYHVDQSAMDGKIGIKVTYIFSGAHKVDGNPHEPISDAVLAKEQAEVDRIRDMFAAAIARYRVMDLDAVMNTEAQWYAGDEAISVGLADSTGTLEDLLAELSQPQDPDDVPDDQETMNMPTEAPATPNAPAPAASATAADTMLAELTRAVQASTLSASIKVAMLDPKVTTAITAVDQIDSCIATAGQIADLCKAAKLDDMAASFVTRGVSVEQARTELAGAVADAPADEIVTALPQTQPQNKSTHSSSQDVYSRRRAAAAGTGTHRGD